MAQPVVVPRSRARMQDVWSGRPSSRGAVAEIGVVIVKAHKRRAFGFGHPRISIRRPSAKAKTLMDRAAASDRRSARPGPNLPTRGPNLRGGWDRHLSLYYNDLTEYGPNLGVPNGGPSLFV